MIRTIGIIGSGNVAWHLVSGFVNLPSVTVKWITSRNEKTGSDLAEIANVKYSSTIPNDVVDLVLICVNDDAINDVVSSIPPSTKVAYTSGTISIEKLGVKHNNLGVFYPLQTFTKGKDVELKNVPFLIESNNQEFTIELKELAQQLSENVQEMNSEQRKQLHIAAVFSNNFVNHLLYLAQEHLKENNIEQEILNPLIRETVNKAFELNPFQAQSGPAKRNDKTTISSHLNELTGLQKDIYSLITESIIKTYSK